MAWIRRLNYIYLLRFPSTLLVSTSTYVRHIICAIPSLLLSMFGGDMTLIFVFFFFLNKKEVMSEPIDFIPCDSNV